MKTVKLGSEHVAWDLSALYDRLDDPRIATDAAAVRKDAEHLASQYRGTIASGTITARQLQKLMAEEERINAAVGRIGEYAELMLTTDNLDQGAKNLVAKAQELGSDIASTLVLFPSSWGRWSRRPLTGWSPTRRWPTTATICCGRQGPCSSARRPTCCSRSSTGRWHPSCRRGPSPRLPTRRKSSCCRWASGRCRLQSRPIPSSCQPSPPRIRARATSWPEAHPAHPVPHRAVDGRTGPAGAAHRPHHL